MHVVLPGLTAFPKSIAVSKYSLTRMGLVQLAEAIPEGKVKVTMADLDRLIRLEESLREEEKAEGTKVILCWEGSAGNGRASPGEPSDDHQSD